LISELQLNRIMLTFTIDVLAHVLLSIFKNAMYTCDAEGFTKNNGPLIQAFVKDEGHYWSKAGG
jgi:hypothetical protein